ncbi:hypothetical protein GTO89_03350 [Heliobacterium gestii]|uniref:Guanylate cyclase domain-containing protein n=1 Tax=Heliomicrobium gestii TaxID=2699 RepID=A0A845L904_HELGE|nr:adenylate/guanylate cyclase domain-containing protein [Heliomicrobium gestii]MBM7865830.1 class 3 adenylate cyclase [Heliomicrobium gestii]MZP42071.1 hypothetical protein [Heliomicrobium gestii]
MNDRLFPQYKQLQDSVALCNVFFDLVDSTRLKQQLGPVEGVALSLRHNQLCAETAEAYQGQVVKHIGDAIYAVFPNPLPALLAALDVKYTILKENLPFQTKIGLSFGLVTPVRTPDADYLGAAVDMAARLASQSAPNQVLLDESTFQIVKSLLKSLDTIIFRFLGIQDLKGLSFTPLYELSHSDLGFVQEQSASSAQPSRFFTQPAAAQPASAQAAPPSSATPSPGNIAGKLLAKLAGNINATPAGPSPTASTGTTGGGSPTGAARRSATIHSVPTAGSAGPGATAAYGANPLGNGVTPVSAATAAAVSTATAGLSPLVQTYLEPVPVADEAFRQFLRRISLNREDVDQVYTMLQNMHYALKDQPALPVRRIRPGGSFMRGTMIRPKKSLDLIVEIAPVDGATPNVTEVLGQIRATLSKMGWNRDVEEQETCLVLGHEDSFRISPVLALVEEEKEAYYLPNGPDTWIPRDPQAPERWMAEAFRRHGPSFLALIRILRAWQRTNCRILRTLHLEMLTDLLLRKVRLEPGPEGLYNWFHYIHQIFSQQRKPFLADPSDPAYFVDGYLMTNAAAFNQFGRLLSHSLQLATEAVNLAQQKQYLLVQNKWRALLGPGFGV